MEIPAMTRWRPVLVLSLLATLAATTRADSEALPGVYRWEAPFEVAETHDRLYKALEAEQFWVVFEADMGERMARFADRWGADYNRNRLGAVRSLVFCNIEWTNRIANADPALLALCPLHLTLYEQGGDTWVVLPRLSHMAQGSPGLSRATELEAELRGIVERALRP
jgi:uncharacterized protein (DUF302 family)